MGFDAEVWLVTGASSGIGLAIAQALVRRGARVALMARRGDVMEELRARWGAPERVLVVPGDVTRREDCRRAVDATIAHFGTLDGLVHSAGVSQRGRVADTRPEVFRQLMDLNFHSTVDLVQAALPTLKARHGHVVVISSVVGHIAPPWRGGYAASKHAVQALMDALRVETHDEGVHVLTVSPGFVRTAISYAALTADGTPHGQLDADTAGGLDPADVAERVLAAIARRARDLYPAGPLETLGLVLGRFAPTLLDRVFLRRFRANADVKKAGG